ncbi:MULTISPECIES: hypothetical protein [Streptomyces]|uniref:hypothetical protein n=1 Tax=Streptomyces TaxID=1883 RepID=UPI00342D9D82
MSIRPGSQLLVGGEWATSKTVVFGLAAASGEADGRTRYPPAPPARDTERMQIQLSIKQK